MNTPPTAWNDHFIGPALLLRNFTLEAILHKKSRCNLPVKLVQQVLFFNCVEQICGLYNVWGPTVPVPNELETVMPNYYAKAKVRNNSTQFNLKVHIAIICYLCTQVIKEEKSKGIQLVAVDSFLLHLIKPDASSTRYTKVKEGASSLITPMFGLRSPPDGSGIPVKGLSLAEFSQFLFRKILEPEWHSFFGEVDKSIADFDIRIASVRKAPKYFEDVLGPSGTYNFPETKGKKAKDPTTEETQNNNSVCPHPPATDLPGEGDSSRLNEEEPTPPGNTSGSTSGSTPGSTSGSTPGSTPRGDMLRKVLFPGGVTTHTTPEDIIARAAKDLAMWTVNSNIDMANLTKDMLERLVAKKFSAIWNSTKETLAGHAKVVMQSGNGDASPSTAKKNNEIVANGAAGPSAAKESSKREGIASHSTGSAKPKSKTVTPAVPVMQSGNGDASPSTAKKNNEIVANGAAGPSAAKESSKREGIASHSTGSAKPKSKTVTPAVPIELDTDGHGAARVAMVTQETTKKPTKKPTKKRKDKATENDSRKKPKGRSQDPTRKSTAKSHRISVG
jgi:hypothetical protein